MYVRKLLDNRNSIDGLLFQRCFDLAFELLSFFVVAKQKATCCTVAFEASVFMTFECTSCHIMCDERKRSLCYMILTIKSDFLPLGIFFNTYQMMK